MKTIVPSIVIIKMKTIVPSLVTILMLVDRVYTSEMYIKVRSDDIRGPFHHFWRSTGFCPPDPHQKSYIYDLNNDMLQNLAYIGGIPHSGINQVRIHWLLDLITVSRYTTGLPAYNFTYLDQLIRQLYINGLKPGFEVMGNPSNIFNDFENKTQVYMWSDLIRLTALRYIEQFGLDYVKTWNFETWNAPDCNQFDMNMTVQGFANYYDASSEGLKGANSSLIFGGPAGGCDTLSTANQHDSYEEFLLEHVVNGINYFTGEKGVRLDFISLHKKGSGLSSNIIDGEISSMESISRKYPSLSNKPFINDGADPVEGWNKDYMWRAGSIYAAMVVKVIIQHQNIIITNPNSSINYQLLSNDNGFLSYYPHQFTQRTLLARFQMNNTNPPYTTFLQKPVYNVMCMLSLLGDQQLVVNGQYSDSPIRSESNNGVLATVHIPTNNKTSDSWQMSILLYDSDDTRHGTDSADVEWNWFINPPNPTQELMLVVYDVSGLYNNGPYPVWSGLYNKTDYPTQDQFHYLRQHEGLTRVLTQPVKPGPGQVLLPPNWQILQPEVTLLHLCARSTSRPEEVTGVRFIKIREGEVLVVWSDDNIPTKCVFTYEVGYSPNNTGPFQRVNPVDTIATITVISPSSHNGLTGDDLVRGYYVVRAVDYWKREGPYSKPRLYSP